MTESGPIPLYLTIMGPVTAIVRCVLYLRISLDATGEQLAIARQRKECMAIAAARGWTVVAEFIDNSISAYSKDKVRPGYDAMVKAYQAGQFEALICWDLDRLSRQPRQLEDWIDAAEDRGLILVTANGEADLSTDGGRLFARIKAAVARGESERKAARQRAAMRQRAESGKPPLGVRLTGYTTAGEVLEDEAEVIRQVFTRFWEGEPLRAIAIWLDEQDVPTRHGQPWWPSTVRTILANPRYAGRAIYRGEPTGQAGTWPPLVSGDVFDAVQDLLADRRRPGQAGTYRKHLGSGLYLCGICDGPLGSHTAGPPGPPGQRSLLRYRCPRGGHVTRSAGPVDNLIITLICARLAAEAATDLFEPETGEAARASAEIRNLRARLRKTGLDYDADLIDGARYKAKKDKLTAQLDAAEVKRAQMSGAPSVIRRLAAAGPDPDGVRAAWEAEPLGARRTAIAAAMTVRLDRAPRGRHFDPATVRVGWTPRIL